MKEYTDGYACSLQIRYPHSLIEHEGDGFAVLLSQFGFQTTYDSQTQVELGINDFNVNPTSPQGWNGVAVHSVTDIFASVQKLQIASLQM